MFICYTSSSGVGGCRSVKLEIEFMKKLFGHPNVVDLKAVYEEEDYVHLVMELCAGGELFHQLEKHGGFFESKARVLQPSPSKNIMMFSMPLVLCSIGFHRVNWELFLFLFLIFN
jgi:hypothetical protein